MVKFMLCIRVDFQNLIDLQPPQGGCDDPEFYYYFKLKCMCQEVTMKEICMSLDDTVTDSVGNTTNLVKKCKLCGSKGTITLIPGYGSPLTNNWKDNGGYGDMMLFDCDGVKPMDFAFSRGWKAETVEGANIIEDIDLSLGKFAGEDEGSLVKIYNVADVFLEVWSTWKKHT